MSKNNTFTKDRNMKFTAIVFSIIAVFGVAHARQGLIGDSTGVASAVANYPPGALTCPTGEITISDLGRPCGLTTAAATMSCVPVADYNNPITRASILQGYDFWFCDKCRIDGKRLKPEQIHEHFSRDTTKDLCSDLQEAMIAHNYHQVKSIINTGCFEINKPLDDSGTTPLIFAVNHALYKGSVRTGIIRLLLACPGININAKITHAGQTQTALMRAVVMGFPIIVKILLMAGADTEIRDADGDTALSLAQRGKTRRGCCDLLTTKRDGLHYTLDERMDFATEDFYSMMCCCR
jgi:hypothetical protein